MPDALGMKHFSKVADCSAARRNKRATVVCDHGALVGQLVDLHVGDKLLHELRVFGLTFQIVDEAGITANAVYHELSDHIAMIWLRVTNFVP